jgi:hypothetical protein
VQSCACCSTVFQAKFERAQKFSQDSYAIWVSCYGLRLQYTASYAWEV